MFMRRAPRCLKHGRPVQLTCPCLCNGFGFGVGNTGCRPSNSPMPTSQPPYEHVTCTPLRLPELELSRFAQANQLNCFPAPTFAQDEQSQPAEVHLLSRQTG